MNVPDARAALSTLVRMGAGRRAELIGSLPALVAEACWVAVRTLGDEARRIRPMEPEELRGWLGRLAGMDERAAAAVVLRAAGLRWKAVERHVGLTRQWLVRLIADGEKPVRRDAAAKDVARLAQVGMVPAAQCGSATAERHSRRTPPGQRWWTPDAVLARLREAVDVVRRLPGTPRLEFRSSWPDIVRDPDEAAGGDPVLRRPLPTPEQVARADEVLEWLAAVDPVDAAVLWWGAAGAPWSEVGARAGLPPKRARRKWRAALYRLASDLNLAGVPVRGRPRRRARAGGCGVMVLPFDWAFMSQTWPLNWTVEDPCRLCDDREVHEQAAVLLNGGWARHTVLPVGKRWAVQIRLVRRPPNIVVLERFRRRLFPKEKEGPLYKVCGGAITKAPKQSRYCSDECRKVQRREYDRARRNRTAAAAMEAAA